MGHQRTAAFDPSHGIALHQTAGLPRGFDVPPFRSDAVDVEENLYATKQSAVDTTDRHPFPTYGVCGRLLSLRTTYGISVVLHVLTALSESSAKSDLVSRRMSIVDRKRKTE